MRNISIKKSTPSWQEEFISRKMESLPERIAITNNVKFHMRHKPYQNDFPSEMIIK